MYDALVMNELEGLADLKEIVPDSRLSKIECLLLLLRHTLSLWIAVCEYLSHRFVAFKELVKVTLVAVFHHEI